MEVVRITDEFQTDTLDIAKLMDRAPWRQAADCRITRPRKRFAIGEDGEYEPLVASYERIERGEGVERRFFGQRRKRLIAGVGGPSPRPGGR